MQYNYTNLRNRKAVVIGGSSGIGLEIAMGFMKSGALVAISGRSADKIKKALVSFKKAGLNSPEHFTMDVTSYSSVQKALQKSVSMFKSVDIMVCSAGIHHKAYAVDMKPSDWQRIIDTNLTGAYYADTVFGKHMIKNRKGAIINIGSLASRVALSKTAAYNVSKSGVEMLTKSLAVEWAPFGVRVNAILPGVFRTPLNENALKDRLRVKNILNHTPMKRFGRLPEIVSSAVFLASDDSSYITGTSVAVDGGFLAYAGF